MLIGSHVSMSGKKMLEAASESAAGFGANTFMIYTGAPQNTRRKKIEDLNIEAGQAHMKEHGMSNIVVHAPYIINIANTVRDGVFEHGVEFLQEEIVRTEHLGSSQIVLHPGSHVGAGADKGIESIIKGLMKHSAMIMMCRSLLKRWRVKVLKSAGTSKNSHKS